MGESVEHKRLVKALIEELKHQKFEIINASCDGYEPCPEIDGGIPDVKAYRKIDETVIIGSAKTDPDFDLQQTESELRRFSDLVMSGGASKGKAVDLFIAVPKGSEAKLQAYLVKLGLSRKPNISTSSF